MWLREAPAKGRIGSARRVYVWWTLGLKTEKEKGGGEEERRCCFAFFLGGGGIFFFPTGLFQVGWSGLAQPAGATRYVLVSAYMEDI